MNRYNAKRFYDKQKAKHIVEKGKSAEHNEQNKPIAVSMTDNLESEEAVSSNTGTNESLLTVKMPFFTKVTKSGQKKRQSRALKRSYQRIETLEDQNEALRKKLRNAQKRIQRVEASKQKNPLTPKSKTNALLKKSGFRPECVPDTIRKQLLYAECVNEEVKTLMTQEPQNMACIQKVMSGRVIKKYRMRSFLQRKTKLERRKVIEVSHGKKNILRAKAEKIKSDVRNFLSRDDNSREMPGKGDTVKVGAFKKQKRVLNDYMHNLRLKFLSEVGYTVSKASFCRLRPKEIALVNFASRSVCLCQRHQNMSFKIRALKNMKVCSTTSPDAFVEMYKNVPSQLDNMLANMEQDTVKFQQWKRVKLQNGKERMRIVDVELSREEFNLVMKKEFADFVSHVDRVVKQYKSVKEMKETLPKNHVLVQMDFSENYNCQTVEEIQSAYWNSSMVTLHPTIVYFNDNENGNLRHRSLVYVSEVLNHTAAVVSAIITKTVKFIKTLVPDLAFVHFWTDSPSSQYRNKSIFDLVYNFETKHGCKATWSYFESGHGKTACDGVGGTAKRNANMAVKQSKAIIQDANDFFAWASNSQSEIDYQLISPEEYDKHNKEIEERKNEIKPIKGTMSVHAVATTGTDNMLFVRETTCACEQCFGEGGFNADSSCKWDKVVLKKLEPRTATSIPLQDHADHGDVTENINREMIEESDFVVAVYEGACYIGQVLQTDSTDETVHVNFMVECGKSVKRFKWPSKADQLWIERGQILQKIDPPLPTGKGGRMFSVPEELVSFMDSKTEM